ncbi:STAS domain-containing protein [bacterium]|nr:STAS domain-containing protein [bacterium]
MEIIREKTSWGILLKATGNLDVSSRGDLADLPSLKSCEEDVILDIAAVDFMDSSGLGTLVQVIRRFRDSDKHFVLAAPTEPVMQLLRLTSVDQIVPIAGTVEEAVEKVRDESAESGSPE